MAALDPLFVIHGIPNISERLIIQASEITPSKESNELFGDWAVDGINITFSTKHSSSYESKVIDAIRRVFSKKEIYCHNYDGSVSNISRQNKYKFLYLKANGQIIGFLDNNERW